VHIDSSQNKASTFQTPDPPQDFNFLSTKPKFWVMFKEKIGLYFFTPLTELLEEKVVYKRGIFLSYIISSSEEFRMHIWLMCVGLPISIWHSPDSWGQVQNCIVRSKQEDTYCQTMHDNWIHQMKKEIELSHC